MTTYTNIADQTATSKLGTYVHAPSVQRLTPYCRINGDPVGRNWVAVDLRCRSRGDVFAAFGNVTQTREMFKRIPQGVGRPPVQKKLLLGLVVAGIKSSMSYRNLEGFGVGLANFVQVDAKLAPDHTTLNKFISQADYSRLETMLATIIVFDKPKIVHVAIDATGLSLQRSGGWLADKPGGDARKGKYRKWHVVTDVQTGFIVAWELTKAYGPYSTDVEVGPDLIRTANEISGNTIETVCADGAYTSNDCFTATAGIEAVLLTPLPSDAVYSNKNSPKDKQPTDRDRLLTQQTRIGMVLWKQRSGYHDRSQAETTFSVTEKAYNNELLHKNEHNQRVEIIIKTRLYNQAIMVGQGALAPWVL